MSEKKGAPQELGAFRVSKFRMPEEEHKQRLQEVFNPSPDKRKKRCPEHKKMMSHVDNRESREKAMWDKISKFDQMMVGVDRRKQMHLERIKEQESEIPQEEQKEMQQVLELRKEQKIESKRAKV